MLEARSDSSIASSTPELGMRQKLKHQLCAEFLFVVYVAASGA
jgi:hypothetical protein